MNRLQRWQGLSNNKGLSNNNSNKASLIFSTAVMLLLFSIQSSAVSFDHGKHSTKIDCAQCHNWQVDAKTLKAIPSAALVQGALKIPLKELCHSCHQKENVNFPLAPHSACVLCHKSTDQAQVIKPDRHKLIDWKSNHSLTVKSEGTESCMQCHGQSFCVNCHLSREDQISQNHSRNFIFTHSIEARRAPQRCDACHTKATCVDCHLKGKRRW